ncbi:hypothetical protein [Paenibacillus tyrfis]|uniref:hypothetical protein n=1 Tax=Paenibacillus tyrfis TaxID=1501230 RepID=UPI00248F6816|nr:hypothetical protein [Paenibacillus tyrfis]
MGTIPPLFLHLHSIRIVTPSGHAAEQSGEREKRLLLSWRKKMMMSPSFAQLLSRIAAGPTDAALSNGRIIQKNTLLSKGEDGNIGSQK